MTTDDNEMLFTVVANDEGQHSIWPAAKTIPSGWYAAGFQASKDLCLEHIAKVWVDMRPRSLVAQMSAHVDSPLS